MNQEPKTWPQAPLGRVLVIDDDKAVGIAIRQALVPAEVTFAQSAAGALARIEAGGTFAAIVCDLFMPGMTGMEFHDQLEKIAPRLRERIVFVTGCPDEPEVTAFFARTSNTCVKKPFRSERLRAAVAAAAHRQ